MMPAARKEKEESSDMMRITKPDMKASMVKSVGRKLDDFLMEAKSLGG